ncbi:MAG: two-component system response regulator [Rhodoferax sp.]|nr:two-component system response regulator [Rhodoferax sp.]
MTTILVVDDSAENLALLSDLLLPLYEVRAVNSGERALRAAASQPRPDLILLDVMMPEIDGYEVLWRLRDNPETANIPVIFVTALDASVDEAHGLELGAVDYITKPIKPAITLARVKAHLDLKAARDWLADRNQALEAEVSRRMAENLFIQNVTIRCLGHLAEIRDPETGNHLRRTQRYVQLLCEELRPNPDFHDFLTDANIDLLVRSAPLHDIGKVGIPDHILLKPGKLTAGEWAVMKTHSDIGSMAIDQVEADAERPVAFLQCAKLIIRHHHEKWDGSGYPDGLAGTAIPIPARLMALADVFDALISRRPYKEPFSLDDAVKMIQGGRGTHFDPAVVDAFEVRIAEFIAVARRYADSEADVRAQIDRIRDQVARADGV